MSWEEYYADPKHRCHVCGEQATQSSTVPIPASWDVCDICARGCCTPYKNLVEWSKDRWARGNLSPLMDLDPILAFSLGSTMMRLGIAAQQFHEDVGASWPSRTG